MPQFIDNHFLLSTDTARRLYHEVAAKAPIVDYHCHVSPREIWEDRRYENITQVWLAGDHYKWRLMRSSGVEERYITGDASDREKFQKFAECLPRAIGNPMVHWCHLELKRYFGYDGVLNGNTAETVWELTQRVLKGGLSARRIIEMSGVAFIGTTDDPTDSLEWHEKIAADPTFSVTVAPSFRPDKALRIDKPDWRTYIDTLSRVSGVAITDLDALKAALTARIAYFADRGCRSADHGLDYAAYREASDMEVNAILQKGLCGEPVTCEEAETFQTCLLVTCAEEYARRDMVMQIHYNCLRNPNSAAFEKLGPDTGVDTGNCFQDHYPGIVDFLNVFDNRLKVVLYCFDPTQISTVASVARAFCSKVKIGAPWWQCDNPIGMKRQLEYFGSVDLVNNCSGMVSDSRKLLSYGSRHEMFRRVLADVLGTMAELGQAPEELLTELAVRLCYEQPRKFFNI